MYTYNSINELVESIKNNNSKNIDFTDIDNLVVKPIRKKMMDEMMRDESSYRFHKFVKIPVLGKTLMYRRISQYTKWILSVFPKEKMNQYSVDIQDELVNHTKEFNNVYELLDDESKETFISLLCLRITGDFSYAAECCSFKPQYLSKKIMWKNNPNIVDAGGYIGDTLLSFIDQSIIPNEYYVYELEDNNFKVLKENVKKAEKYGVKVCVRKKGIYSKDGQLYFVADRDSSKLVDYPTEDSIDVVKIDSDVKMIPDFIKMDIEGSEVEALKGASGIIKNYSPTLAICIYHLKDDFWRIPLLIKEINPDYKHFWIEHYQIGYNETVLYVSK